MSATKHKARQVEEQGYCVIESAYDAAECAAIRALFKRLCDNRGGFSAASPKFSFHPLLEWEPEFAPLYAKPVLVDTMAEIFGDAVRLAHSGAAVFANAHAAPQLTEWHYHYDWPVPSAGLQRPRAERLLCNVYVDGTGPDIGPLIVVPRRLNDTTTPFGVKQQDWPNQLEVHVPPGAAVIFDTALWHCSRRGRAGIRHLWGGHYQGWDNPKPHPADNSAASPTLTAHVEKSPLLKGLLKNEWS